ncbi:MAG: STAS domain-containing protein [Acidobacteria bacterium]|nr:STAS domain-containing protein [Acidobacteriota bacterium]
MTRDAPVGLKESDPRALWDSYFPACRHSHPPGTCRGITLEGRVDLRIAERVGAELDQALRERPGLLDITLGAVTYIDTAGIAVLVEIAGSARQAGVCLRLADPSPAVLGMLEVVRLEGFFPTRPGASEETCNSGDAGGEESP